MAELQLFNFESYKIRVVGTPENPEWVARDVANALAWIIHEQKNKAQKSRNLHPDFSWG